MTNKYLKLAYQFCESHSFDPRLGYNLCCILTRGGAVVSVGFNSITKNSFVDYLADSCDGYCKPFVNQHSEMAAILKARNKIDLRGCKAYVVRMKPSGGMGMARPCHLCQRALKSYGIKRATYSISDREHGVLNLADASDVIHSREYV